MPKRKFFFIKFLIPVFYLILIVYITYAQEIVSPHFVIEGDQISTGSTDGTAPTFGIRGGVNPFAGKSSSTNFSEKIGYNPRIQAFTPYPAVLENSLNYYDRLLIKVNLSNNNAETLFAVIVSSDNFATFQYVQNDGTLGAVLGAEDYRTYTSWGGAAGSYILALNQNTKYKARVKALNGDYTETGYSADSNEIATTVPFVRMNVSNSSLSFGTLNVNSISQTTTVNVGVSTNAYLGYQVSVHDSGNGVSGGLYDGLGNLIVSADMTLTPGVPGYGAQANSLSAVVDPKYLQSGNTVGGIALSSAYLFANSLAVSNETTTVLFKASISPTNKAGIYTDNIYFTVSPKL